MPFPSPTPKPPIKGSLMQQALSSLDANKIEATPDYSGVVNPYYDSAAIENVTIVDTPTYSSKDLESFHKYNTNFNTVDNPYQQRADNQSWQEQLGATIYNMPSNIIAGLVENVGYLATLGETGDDKDYTNALVELGKDLRNWGGAGQEVYQNPNNDMDLSDSGFWFNLGGGIVESIAEFYLTGAGVGSIIGKGTALVAEGAGALTKGVKGVDKAGDFLRYVQKAKNLTDRTLTAASLSYTEGAMSAADVFVKVKDNAQKELDREVLDGQVNQKALDKGYKTNEEYARAIGSEASATTARLTTMLGTVINLTSVGAFFPSMGQQLTFNKTMNAALQQIDDKLMASAGRTLTQEERRYAIKNLINKTDDNGDNIVAKIIKDNNVNVAYKPTNGILEGYHVGAEMVQESIEEVVNELATKAGERAGENKNITDGDLTDKYLRAFTQLEAKDAFSKEAVVAALAGAVGGGGQTALTRYVALTKKPEYETYQAPVMTANDKGEVIPTEQTTLERRRKVSNLGTSPGGREEESSSRKSNYQQEQEDSKFFYDQAKQDLSNQLAFVEKQQNLINDEKNKEPHLIDWNKVNTLQEEMFTRIALSRAVRTGNGEFLINTLQDLHNTDNTKDLGVEYSKQFTQKRNELLNDKDNKDIYGQKQAKLKFLKEELQSNNNQKQVFGNNTVSTVIDNVDKINNEIIEATKKIEQLNSSIQKANTPTQKAKLTQQIKDLQSNIAQNVSVLDLYKANINDKTTQEYIAIKEELLAIDTNPELIQLERLSKELRGKTEAMVKGLTTKADNITTGVIPSNDYKEKANRLANAVKKGSQRWETISSLYNKGEVGDDEYVNELWTLTQLSDVYLEQADKYGYNTPEYQLYKSKVQDKKTEIADMFSKADMAKDAEDFTTKWKTKLNKQFEGIDMPENLKKLSLAKDTTEFLESMKGNEDIMAIEELYTEPFQAKLQENLTKAFAKLGLSIKEGKTVTNSQEETQALIDNLYNENRTQTLKDINDDSKSLIFGQKADRAYKQYQNIQDRIDKLNTGEGKTEFVNNQKELVSKQMAKQKAIYDAEQKVAKEAEAKRNSQKLKDDAAEELRKQAEAKAKAGKTSTGTNTATNPPAKTATELALEAISGTEDTEAEVLKKAKAAAKKKEAAAKKAIKDLHSQLQALQLKNATLLVHNEVLATGKGSTNLADETYEGFDEVTETIEKLQTEVSKSNKTRYEDLVERNDTEAQNADATLYNSEENELSMVNQVAEDENVKFYQELQDRFKEQANFSYSDKESKVNNTSNEAQSQKERIIQSLKYSYKIDKINLRIILSTEQKVLEYLFNQGVINNNGVSELSNGYYVTRQKADYVIGGFTYDLMDNNDKQLVFSDKGNPDSQRVITDEDVNLLVNEYLPELINQTQNNKNLQTEEEKTKSYRNIDLVASNEIIPLEELSVDTISTGDILVWSWEGRKDEENYETPINGVNSVIGDVFRNKEGVLFITVARDAVVKTDKDGQEYTTTNFMTINTEKESTIIYGVKKRIEGKEKYVAGVEVGIENGQAVLSSGQDTIDDILNTFTKQSSNGKPYWSGIVAPYEHKTDFNSNFVLFPTVFKVERKSQDLDGKDVWIPVTRTYNGAETEEYFISEDDYAILADIDIIDRGTLSRTLTSSQLLTKKNKDGTPNKSINAIEEKFYDGDKAYSKKQVTPEMIDKFLSKWAGKDAIPTDDVAKIELLQEKALELLSNLLPEENTRKLVRGKSELSKTDYFRISTKTSTSEEIVVKLDEYTKSSTTPILVEVKGVVTKDKDTGEEKEGKDYYAIAIGRENNSIILLSKNGNIYKVSSDQIVGIIRPKDDNFQKVLTEKREAGLADFKKVKKAVIDKEYEKAGTDYITPTDKAELYEKTEFEAEIDDIMEDFLPAKKLEQYQKGKETYGGHSTFFQLNYLRYVRTVIKSNNELDKDVKTEHINKLNNAINSRMSSPLWKRTVGKMRRVVNQLQQGDFVVVRTDNEDNTSNNRTYMFIEPPITFGGWAIEIGKDVANIAPATGYTLTESKENNLRWITFQDDYKLSGYQFYRNKANKRTTIGYDYNQELSKAYKDKKGVHPYIHENYLYSPLSDMESVMNLKEGDLLYSTNISKEGVRYTGYKIIKSVESEVKDGKTIYEVTYFTNDTLYHLKVDINGQKGEDGEANSAQVLGFGVRRIDNQKRRTLLMQRFLAKTRKVKSVISIPNENDIPIPTSLQWYGFKSRIINPDSKVDVDYWKQLQEGDVVVFELKGENGEPGKTFIRPVANVAVGQKFYAENADGDIEERTMNTLVVYTGSKDTDFVELTPDGKYVKGNIKLADNKVILNNTTKEPVNIITKSYSSSKITIKAVFYAPHNFKNKKVSKIVTDLDKRRKQEYKDNKDNKATGKTGAKPILSEYVEDQDPNDIGKKGGAESAKNISDNTENAETELDSTEIRKGKQGDNYTQGHPLDNNKPMSELEEVFALYMQKFFDKEGTNTTTIEKFAKNHKLKVISINTNLPTGGNLYDEYYGTYDWKNNKTVTKANRPILVALIANDGTLITDNNGFPIVSQITVFSKDYKGTPRNKQEEVRKSIIESWDKNPNTEIILALNSNYPVKSGTKNWLKDGLRLLTQWEEATGENLDIAVAKPQTPGQPQVDVTTDAGTTRKIDSGHVYSILHDKVITYYSKTISEMEPELAGKITNTALATLLLKLNGEAAIPSGGKSINYWNNLDDMLFTGIAMNNKLPVYEDTSKDIPIYELAVIRPKGNPPYLLMRGITKLKDFEAVFGKFIDADITRVSVGKDKDKRDFIKITPKKGKSLQYSFSSNQLEFLKAFIGQKQFNVNSVSLSKDNDNFELLNYNQEVTPNTNVVKGDFVLEDQGVPYKRFVKSNVLMTDVTVADIKLKARGFIYGDITNPIAQVLPTKTDATKEVEIDTGPTIIRGFGKSKKAITEEIENTVPTIVSGFGKTKTTTKVEEKITSSDIIWGEEDQVVDINNTSKDKLVECTNVYNKKKQKFDPED